MVWYRNLLGHNAFLWQPSDYVHFIEDRGLQVAAPGLVGQGQVRLDGFGPSPLLDIRRSPVRLCSPGNVGPWASKFYARQGDVAFFQDTSRTYLVQAGPNLTVDEDDGFLRENSKLLGDLREELNAGRLLAPPNAPVESAAVDAVLEFLGPLWGADFLSRSPAC